MVDVHTLALPSLPSVVADGFRRVWVNWDRFAATLSYIRKKEKVNVYTVSLWFYNLYTCTIFAL